MLGEVIVSRSFFLCPYPAGVPEWTHCLSEETIHWRIWSTVRGAGSGWRGEKHFGKETDLLFFVFSYPLECNSRALKDTAETQPGPVNIFIGLVCFRVKRSVFGKQLGKTDIHGGGSML